MRKFFRIISSGLLTGALALTMTLSAAAAESSKLDYLGGSRWVPLPVTIGSTDLFGDALHNLMPGDSGETALQLRNTSGRGCTFYLRLAAVTDAGTRTQLETQYGKQYSQQLLGQIQTTISCGSTVLYEGKMDGTEITKGAELYSAGGVMLGHLSNEMYSELTLTYALSADMGNEYANTLAALTWDFAAVADVDPPVYIPPINPPGGGVIPDGEVPKGDLPVLDKDTVDGAGDAENTIIVDPDTPMGNLPQTGTQSLPQTLLLPISIAVLAAAALIAALLLGR
ncbi:MAG: hypothetical protein RRY53_00770, partial [Pseudoflavonifractor sp.]